jgi:hypothetical protein
MFRPYKFLVVSVLQEVDDEGKVVREAVSEQPTVVFGIDGLQRYAETFELELAAQTEKGE